jgi:glycosyltransferase involved in cell wall biosynthesis
VMKISIALCTYNGEKFLNEQLESFLVQTRLPEELIVGDDRSNDTTVKLIEDFAKTSPFPVHIHINKNNLGSTSNFDETISRCNGDLIFLSDQDDVWNVNKLEQIERVFIENKQVGMVFTNAEIVDENLKAVGNDLWHFTFPKECRRGSFIDNLLWQNVVTGATMAFRSEFRELFSPIPTDIPNAIHDAWISLVIAANAEVKFINENLIKYRQHSNQQLGLNLNDNANYAKSITYNQNEILRLEKMLEIFRTNPIFSNTNTIDLIDTFISEKQELIKHYEARMNLSKNSLHRILPIFDELKTGRYAKFSKGFLSAAKDLFEN